jgi:acyl-CoA reductase-like NAD-dependent aldehyde dehydrogenase
VIRFKNLEELPGLFQYFSYGHTCGFWGDADQNNKGFIQNLPFGRIRMNGALLSPDPWRTVRGLKRSGNHGNLGKGLFDQISEQKSIE